jgi:hypothetical protein
MDGKKNPSLVMSLHLYTSTLMIVSVRNALQQAIKRIKESTGNIRETSKHCRKLERIKPTATAEY